MIFINDVQKIYINIISGLLHRANTSPFINGWFYARIKDPILRKYGKPIATDQQHIVKKCWSCTDGVFSGFDNGYSWVKREKQPCNRCLGTGIHDEFSVLLEVWQFGRHEFHIPVERIRDGEYFKHPSTCLFGFDPIRNKIEGYIRHEPHPKSRQAFWILAWWFTPKKAFRYHYLNIKGLIKIKFWQSFPVKVLNRIRYRRRQHLSDDLPF